jgi:hypothetical protein
MGQLEPPNPRPPLFLVGRDRGGHWVVQDERGLTGGLFVNRTEAMKFALFENGHRADGVVLVPGFFEIDFGADESARAA